MVRGTGSVPVEDAIDASLLDDQTFDEVMHGLPQVQKEIRLDRIANDRPSLPGPTSLLDVPEGMSVVTNLKYTEEIVMTPDRIIDANGNAVNKFSGRKQLQFIDGRLTCSDEQAEYIKSICPYVFIEPKEGSIFTHPETGFETRVAEAYTKYDRLQRYL